MNNFIYGIYNVMTKNRAVNFNMRVREDIREEFKIAAHVKGSSASNLIHQYMVDYASKVCAADPAKFEMHRQLLKEEEEEKESQKLGPGVEAPPKGKGTTKIKIKKEKEIETLRKAG